MVGEAFKPSRPIRYAITIGAAAALLAGCGGSQPPIVASGAMTRGRAPLQHATDSDLLYVVDSTRGVYVYRYPSGEEVGLLKVNASAGLCSDKKGDVFVTDAVDVEVLAMSGSMAPASSKALAKSFCCSGVMGQTP